MFSRTGCDSRLNPSPCLGTVRRTSLVSVSERADYQVTASARTPGVVSAATRTALFSDSESTIPHNSAVPSWTMTLISDRQVNGC